MDKQIIVILILYIIAYVYSIVFAPSIAGKKDGILGYVNDIHKTSLISLDGAEVLTQWRGDNYYISDMSDELAAKLKTCLLSAWGAMHIFLYTFIGYFAPDYFWETFVVGAAFEWYECLEYNCEDPLDLAWNSIGFMMGKSLRTLTSSKN